MKKLRPIIPYTLLAVAGFAISTHAAESTTPRAVVELYTSQGCNSCPPADRVLYEINQEHSELLLLSFHVDYWNYLGWTDPFSDAKFSERQRDYANRMRERYVYTPQVIINGDYVVRATDRQKIESTSAALPAILDHADIALNSPQPNQPTHGTVKLHATNQPTTGFGAHIWLIGFDHEHQRDVLSGENAGKRLVHANVVREMVALGAWDGTERKIPFTLSESYDGGIAVLIQNGRGGPITGAEMIRFKE